MSNLHGSISCGTRALPKTLSGTPTCKTGCIKTKTFSVIKQTFLVIKPCSTETVSKKICGPSARKFFSREIFGAASVSPCAGRNLRRRVLAEICAAVCWPKIWRKSAPPCCVVIFDALVLHVSVSGKSCIHSPLYLLQTAVKYQNQNDK